MSMRIEKIAVEYINLLQKNQTRSGVQKVVNHLNSLVYSTNKRPLSKQDKIAILEVMRKQASMNVILKHADNKGILDLIEVIETELGEEGQ